MMEEKMMQVRNNHPRRSQKRRRRRFPWGDIAAMLLVAALFGFVFLSWGEGPAEGKTPARQPQEDTLANTLADSVPEEDSGWNLVLVNSQNPFPRDREAELKELPGGEQVDARIHAPLMELLEAAKETNWDQLPEVVSGFRTREKQQLLYDQKVCKYRNQGYPDREARELAEQWVALPGQSEHHTGLAVDINGATYDLYFWLQENSYKYGFIFRYPGNKTEITGVSEEVWHYRYVGVEAATEMYEKGLCLEEYLAERQGEE